MIEKKIHYIWFGKNEMSEKLKECVDTWDKTFAGYEFTKWNEDNCPKDIFFLEKMLQFKQWAFASDFLRFYILYHHGGIYLDTDMYFYKGINEYLTYDYFLGKEDANNLSAGVIGSVKNHPFNKLCMDFYINYNSKEKIDEFLSNKILIPQVLNYSYQSLNKSLYNIEIFDSIVFYPVSFSNRNNLSSFVPVDPKTKAVHLWTASWHDEYDLLYSGKYLLSLKYFIRKLFLSNEKLKYFIKFSFTFISRLAHIIKAKILNKFILKSK